MPNPVSLSPWPGSRDANAASRATDGRARPHFAPSALVLAGLATASPANAAAASAPLVDSNLGLFIAGVIAIVSMGLAVRVDRTFRRRLKHLEALLTERTSSLRSAEAAAEASAAAQTESIEALKRAQEETARERARFKFIFEAAPVGLSWVVPGDDATHIVNPAHERITGVSEQDALQPGAFSRVSHPDDYRRQQVLTHKFLRGEIDHYSLEKRYLHRDGRTVWASLTSRMFTDPVTGAKQSITALIDITDLKHAEEINAREQARLRFIFEALPVGIAWRLTGQPETRIVNPSHARISGVPIEKCRELDLYRLGTHPEDRGKQDAVHARLVAGEIDQYQLEKRYVHPDGTVKWVTLAVRFFAEESTGEIQEISTLVDITARKQSEDEKEVLNRQLLDISRQAGMAEVATSVLHNVGNVLNSVNVSATLVDEKLRGLKIVNVPKIADLLQANSADLANFLTTDPRGKKITPYLASLGQDLLVEQAAVVDEVTQLRKNIEHIKEVVAMQQSYARVSGVAELVSLTGLIDDAVRMNAASLARHEIVIARDYAANPTLDLDRHKIMQILVNLIRNAKHACDASGRSDKNVTLATSATADCVRVSVRDNGIGIPAGNLTRIFAHGFTTKKDGHGFGLHSSALAAKELGGTLRAQSEGEGLGSVFTLELPLPLGQSSP